MTKNEVMFKIKKLQELENGSTFQNEKDNAKFVREQLMRKYDVLEADLEGYVPKLRKPKKQGLYFTIVQLRVARNKINTHKRRLHLGPNMQRNVEWATRLGSIESALDSLLDEMTLHRKKIPSASGIKRAPNKVSDKGAALRRFRRYL